MITTTTTTTTIEKNTFYYIMQQLENTNKCINVDRNYGETNYPYDVLTWNEPTRD